MLPLSAAIFALETSHCPAGREKAACQFFGVGRPASLEGWSPRLDTMVRTTNYTYCHSCSLLFVRGRVLPTIVSLLTLNHGSPRHNVGTDEMTHREAA